MFKEFRHFSNIELKVRKDLNPLKKAEEKDNFEELYDTCEKVEESKETEIVDSGLWLFKVEWNEDKEAVQVSCFSASTTFLFRDYREKVD